MSTHRTAARALGHHPAKTENTVPFFWPFELGAAIAKGEMNMFTRGLASLVEAEKLEFGLKPAFATANRMVIELHTLRLRDFTKIGGPDECPTLVDAPYAGHTAVIADFHDGQSLIQTLLANGLSRVLVTDWKNATAEMKDYDIDNYLAEINVCVDDLGGRSIWLAFARADGCRQCTRRAFRTRSGAWCWRDRRSIQMRAAA